MKTLTDVLSNLIKFGFGSYNERMGMSMERIMTCYNGLIKDYEKAIKNKIDYDTSLIKAVCLLFRKK